MKFTHIDFPFKGAKKCTSTEGILSKVPEQPVLDLR
jgi:hypothetical protein